METPTKRRRIPGIVILAVVILLLAVQAQRMSVQHRYCEGEVPVPGNQAAPQGALSQANPPDVLMLGASWCPYCKAAIRFFDRHQVDYCEYDIETSPIGSRLYEALGGRGIPVLLIGDQRLHGFDEVSAERALKASGLWAGRVPNEG